MREPREPVAAAAVTAAPHPPCFFCYLLFCCFAGLLAGDILRVKTGLAPKISMSLIMG